MQTLNTDVVLSAAITTVVIIVILIIIQVKFNLNAKIFYGTTICGLPLSYIINQIKIPILEYFFKTQIAQGKLDLIDGILWVLVVGFTEELIKFLLFLLLIFVLFHYKMNDQRNSTTTAYSVGIGFGIGEIWYLASLLLNYQSPNIAGSNLVAWFGGFGFERFFVTFAHASIFMIILFGYRKNYFQTVLFLILAMFVHALYDFPIILNAIGLISSLELSLIIILELIAGFVVSFFFLDNFLRLQPDKDRFLKKEQLLQRARDSIK